MTKRYLYDARGGRIGLRTTPATGPAEQFTYGYDPHGSVSLLLATTGAARAAYAYRPYGSADPGLTTGDTSERDPLNPYRFQSKRLDSGSGTFDMGARRFGPDIARFLQPDRYLGAAADLGLALDPLNQNRYSFAGGNPVSYVETDGHAFAVDDGGCAGGTAPYWCNEPPPLTMLPHTPTDSPALAPQTDPGPIPSDLRRTAAAPAQSEPSTETTWQGGHFSFTANLLGGSLTASVAVIGQTRSGSSGLLFEAGFGGTTSVAGVSVSAAPIFSNARTLADYTGWFGQMGGSVLAGVGLGADYQTGFASDGTRIDLISAGPFLGFQPSWAVIPIPAEFHGYATYTWRLLGGP